MEKVRAYSSSAKEKSHPIATATIAAGGRCIVASRSLSVFNFRRAVLRLQKLSGKYCKNLGSEGFKQPCRRQQSGGRYIIRSFLFLAFRLQFLSLRKLASVALHSDAYRNLRRTPNKHSLDEQLKHSPHPDWTQILHFFMSFLTFP